MRSEDAASGAARRSDIDLIKTVAIFSTVCIHVCDGGLRTVPGSGACLTALVWRCLAAAGVPLFFMCSGALMADHLRPLPLKKLFGRSIPRLLAALFFWAAMYACLRLYISGGLNAAGLRAAAADLVLFRHEQHLYFLHIMLLFYLCLPIVRSFLGGASSNTVRYFLCVWSALGILYPALRRFPPFSSLSGIPTQWALNMAWASLGYGVLGRYLSFSALPPRRTYPALSALLGFALVFGVTAALTFRTGDLQTAFLEGMSPGVCLMAAGIFALLQGRGGGRLTEFVSRASFCIYLSHRVFLMLFDHLGFTPQLRFPALGIPAVTLAAAACGAALYAALRRVPVVNKWLI